jgi:ubiquinone/menaquinone biosynthesis C-methylase UbiE
MQVREDWWISEDEGGFFGAHYLMGDDSKLGPYRKRSMPLEERTEREVAFAIQALQLKPNQQVLDCPCGYGRHSIALAQRGIRVIGVDRNNCFLNLARRSAKQQGVDKKLIEFVRGDIRDLPVESGRFDAAIIMFTSIGFFPNDAEDLKALGEFYRALKPGGRLLIHLDYNYERRITPKYKDERVTRYLKNGSRLIIEEKLVRVSDKRRIIGAWRIIQSNNKQIYRRTYSLRLYSPTELSALLEQSGFRNIELKGDLDNSKAELAAASYETVIIAQKLL